MIQLSPHFASVSLFLLAQSFLISLSLRFCNLLLLLCPGPLLGPTTLVKLKTNFGFPSLAITPFFASVTFFFVFVFFFFRNEFMEAFSRAP